MAILQMRKICICALKKERKPILEQIQQSGLMEISEIAGETDGFEKIDTAVAKSGFERNAALAETALDILDRFAPEEKGMFDSLKGKKVIKNDEFSQVATRRDAIIGYANRIVQLEKDVAAAQADIVKMQGQIDAIVPWLDMDVQGMTKGTLRTSYFYGSIPESLTQEQLYKKIEENGNFPAASEVKIFYSDKNQTCVAGFCMKKEETKFEDALRSIGFSKPALIMRSVPKESLKHWKANLEKYKNKKAEAEEALASMAKHREELKYVADYFRSRSEKYDVLGKLSQSKHVFFITGYVPEKDEEKLKEVLLDKYSLFIETSDIGDNEEAPVLLSNGGFGAPVEGVVESFGLPKKGELDPSGIMAFFYYFLFGMMLSDAAYGLIITVACFVVIKKFPRMEKSLNKSLHMFMYCGISTFIWGVLFGGYFGDVVSVFSNTFLHKNIELKPVWFAPLDDPMRLLVYSLGFGILHMFVGLALKAYVLIKEKKYMDCLYDVGFWYMFLVGLILMLVSSDMFESIFQMKIAIGDVGLKVVYAITAIGALGILFMSGRRKKNKWPLRLALGAYDLYNVTSWLSDVLSYSRLLALGLATGVIASVVNLMGTMMGDGIAGIILFVIVFIIGHTLNIAINLLGAYVHTNRLQYVEFFGKFYEGGGKAFNPFKLKNKYIDVEE